MKKLSSVTVLLSWLTCFLLCFSVAFLIMSKREFDEVTVNQILFHMQLMKDNVVTMPGDFINVFLWHLKNSLLCAFSLLFLMHGEKIRSKAAFLALDALLLFSWYAVPGKYIDDIFFWVQAGFIAILVIAALCRLDVLAFSLQKICGIARYCLSGWRIAGAFACIVCYSLAYVHFFDYFRGQVAHGDFYEEGAYVAPTYGMVKGSGSKNLLIIYCESIEETFGEKEIMGEDLLEPLRPYIEYPDLHIGQMPGADFTIGGIVATQCGIPLKSISILSGNLTGWSLDKYLPGAICLGDYLKKDGYHNVYYNGSSGVFSGLNKFFLNHGYEEFAGKEEWLKKDPGAALNMWALYDSDMIDRSIARIDELMASGQKFSFALSTMDTHEPGFLSPPCRDGGFTDGWPGFVRCSMTQVGRLLGHIRDKGWEDKFVILVMGDHQARMPKLGNADLKNAGSRYVLCSLSRDGGLLPNRKEITHFDLFPTLLAALGFTIEGDRLGFGWNAFSRSALPPKGYMETLKKNVLNQSETYQKLWFPEGTNPHAQIKEADNGQGN